MDRLVIIGAGGHGRVVADIARALGRYKSILFLDDAFPEHDSKVEVKGKSSEFYSYIHDSEFIVAVGHNEIRKKLQEHLSQNGATLATLVHPSAVIGVGVALGKGSVVMAGVIINTGTYIGDGVIVNTSASVDHDCRIESFTHISVGSHLAGTVTVGKQTFIGAGAVVINNTYICADCTIGAGAVVVESIKKAGTYVGVPARRVS